MNIVVLAGGISSERDVSISSGKKIYQALKQNGHRVILLDVYLGYDGGSDGSYDDGRLTGGGFINGEATAAVFEQEADWLQGMVAVGEESPDIEAIKARRPDGDKNFFGPHVISICRLADVVFMALHGENGENGKIQACFDLLGIAYTGADYVGSALALNKALAKELFQYHGIPTPAGIRLKQGGTAKEPPPFPCIVKANSGGSSVGVCIAGNEEEYEKALTEAFQYDQEAVVEQYIKGREFSVGVLSGAALPVIEMAPLQGFYDYKNKYQPGLTKETCPAELAAEKTREMQLLAEKVFQVLRLKNYARMDFIMDEQGAVFCLEANTLPGMTPTSLLPQEAEAAGISFTDLCERIIRNAL